MNFSFHTFGLTLSRKKFIASVRKKYVRTANNRFCLDFHCRSTHYMKIVWYFNSPPFFYLYNLLLHAIIIIYMLICAYAEKNLPKNVFENCEKVAKNPLPSSKITCNYVLVILSFMQFKNLTSDR